MKTLKDYRVAAELSQEALAIKIHVSVSTIRNWEQNKTCICDAKWWTVRFLQLALNINESELSELCHAQLCAVSDRQEKELGI